MVIISDHRGCATLSESPNYEGTDYDLTENYRKGSPHQTDERTLCRLDTEVSTIIQARTRQGEQQLPADIGGISWRALGTPCSSIFTPWYLGSLKVPKEYQNGTSHFTKDSAYWTARNLSKSLDMRYRSPSVDRIKNSIEQFENKEFADQAEIENNALELYNQNPDKARAYLTDYSSHLAAKALERMNSLINDIESH